MHSQVHPPAAEDISFFSPDVRSCRFNASPALTKDILHLKTLLQRERQISEERLRTLEHHDALLAAANSRQPTYHSQESTRKKEDASLLEKKLHEEKKKRAEAEQELEEVMIALEIFKHGHGSLRHRLLELIEKEINRLNEHPRDIPERNLSLETLAPKEVVAAVGRLLEKYVLYTNSSADRDRTELLERSRTRQEVSNQRIEELEVRNRDLEQEIRATSDGRVELENRLRLAESEKIQLKLELDLARSEVSNERVTRDQTLEFMKRSIEECRAEIASMQEEADQLKAHCSSVEELEASHRDEVERLRLEINRMQAELDFCEKNHIYNSRRESPRSGSQRSPLLDTAVPQTQSTDILSASIAETSQPEMPTPLMPPLSTSQPEMATEKPPQRRVTRARKGGATTAESLTTSNETVSDAAVRPPSSRGATRGTKRTTVKVQAADGEECSGVSASSSQAGRQRRRRNALSSVELVS